jgi:hypothetical protein
VLSGRFNFKNVFFNLTFFFRRRNFRFRSFGLMSILLVAPILLLAASRRCAGGGVHHLDGDGAGRRVVLRAKRNRLNYVFFIFF